MLDDEIQDKIEEEYHPGNRDHFGIYNKVIKEEEVVYIQIGNPNNPHGREDPERVILGKVQDGILEELEREEELEAREEIFDPAYDKLSKDYSLTGRPGHASSESFRARAD